MDMPWQPLLELESVMQAAQTTFISSTNWTERIGPAAAIATINKFRREKVAAHLIAIGNQVMQGWERIAERNGLKLHTSGMPVCVIFHSSTKMNFC